jgi:ribose 5-phosphate isomerase B
MNNNEGKNKNKIFIGCDHAGFDLKEKIKEYLILNGHDIEDEGAYAYNPCDDYPDFAFKVAFKVSKENGKGILVCNTGIGMCIAANKIKNIRAVNAHNEDIAKRSRLHNDTNVLCIGAAFVDYELSLKIIKVWLEASFSSEEKHKRRVEKINTFAGNLREERN